ncbi:MAG: helix-turn-helix domain-containing protein [Candidatus Thorarchaeota archaeon]|nr:helix-turn-helix domain-containing protein [Candidatus Thorarchaeota archaeon]
MIEAVLSIASENYYSCELTRSIPVRVNLVSINGKEGFGIIESLDGTEKPLKKYVQFMKKSSSVVQIEVTHKENNQYWTRVVHELIGYSIHETILENGCMNRLPIVITQGFQIHQILAPSQEKFKMMISSLKNRFTSVKIERVQSHPNKLSSFNLTTKQREAIVLAIDRGYYDIPRGCGMSNIASELGVKRVATQERIRRAEKRIMSELRTTQKI